MIAESLPLLYFQAHHDPRHRCTAARICDLLQNNKSQQTPKGGATQLGKCVGNPEISPREG